MTLEDKKRVVYNAWTGRCKELQFLTTNTLFLSIHGSTSHGLDTPKSDVDLVGVTVAPNEFYLGFLHHLK